MAIAPVDPALSEPVPSKPVPSKPVPATDLGTSPAAGTLERLGIRFTAWAERWFPDAFIFVAIAVVVVALGGARQRRAGGDRRQERSATASGA